jgi:hypothetical protein
MMKNALQINIMTRDCCCYVIDAWGGKKWLNLNGRFWLKTIDR